jgi:hypothetical protein
MEFLDLMVLPANLIIVLLFTMLSSGVSYAEEKSHVEAKLGIHIKLDSGYVDSWEAISYEVLNTRENLDDYLSLLLSEYAKYPQGFFKKIRLDTLIICKNLRFESQERAAIPDPFQKTLLLDADYSRYGRNYLIHTMHHELHHCTEFAIWNEMYYSWEAFTALNTKGFLYGSGGASAYLVENRNKDYYSMCHPKEGFSNPYQMTGEEEDRCEIMAFVFTDHQRDKMVEYCQEDGIIMAKLKLIIELMDQFWGTAENYWHRQMAATIGG